MTIHITLPVFALELGEAHIIFALQTSQPHEDDVLRHLVVVVLVAVLLEAQVRVGLGGDGQRAVVGRPVPAGVGPAGGR